MFNRNLNGRQFPDLDLDLDAPTAVQPGGPAPMQNRRGESIPFAGGSFKVQNTLVDDPELGQTHQGTWISRSTESVLPGELDFGPNRKDMNFITSPEKESWGYREEQPDDVSDQMSITYAGVDGSKDAWLAVGFKEERVGHERLGERLRALRDEQRPKRET